VVELGGLVGLLAGWPISMDGACERVYLLYRIYSIHARARARLNALCGVVCLVCIASLYYTTYVLLLVCTYMVYTVCLHQWLVRITALCINVANALTIHAYAIVLLFLLLEMAGGTLAEAIEVDRLAGCLPRWPVGRAGWPFGVLCALLAHYG
jgi:hypothetical protein